MEIEQAVAESANSRHEQGAAILCRFQTKTAVIRFLFASAIKALTDTAAEVIPARLRAGILSDNFDFQMTAEKWTIT
jgi:hypothetical protein